MFKRDVSLAPSLQKVWWIGDVCLWGGVCGVVEVEHNPLEQSQQIGSFYPPPPPHTHPSTHPTIIIPAADPETSKEGAKKQEM